MQNQIINMCRVLIGPNAVVTDDQINDAIERVSLIFPNMDIAQVKSELLSLYGVRIQDFQILEGNERRQPSNPQLSSSASFLRLNVLSSLN